MHQFIKNQISQQKDKDISDNDSVWVHSVSNFIWNHYLINIYETIMIDVLHQLLKSTVIYLIHWLEQLIEKSITVTRKKKDVRHKISNASETTQLNNQFCSVSVFADLKLFQQYSSVKQWTEDDWRVIIH